VALRNLSAHPKNKDRIVSEGGLPYVIALLRSADKSMQEHGAMVVRNVSVNDQNEVRTSIPHP